jgi:predicted nucleotidyltransferase
MDTEKLLKLLNENRVDYIIIGAMAFPVYGYARATLDIDIFVRPVEENLRRLKSALQAFGYDLTDITLENLLNYKVLIRQYDVETDIHPFVKGVKFEELWSNKIRSKFGETKVYFPSLGDMIKMKTAAGRVKDLEDLKYLRKIQKQRKRRSRKKTP